MPATAGGRSAAGPGSTGQTSTKISPSPGCSASRTERSFSPPSSPRIIVAMIMPALAPPAACSAPRAAARRRCRPHSHQGRFRFSGQPRGGCYSRARYYHPGLQRFVGEDPIGLTGGDVNLYAYVWNDPTRFVDPLGLWGVGIHGGGTSEVGAGPSGGAAYQATSSVGVFARGLSAFNVGGYTASGGFAGESNLRQFVFGATAGLGTGLFLTNATRAEDLVGPFDTWTLNLPIGSLQFATAGGTWVGSFALGRSRGV